MKAGGRAAVVNPITATITGVPLNTMAAAMTALRIMRDPFPDVASAVVTSHDLVIGDDGFAARRVAHEASVAAVIVSAGASEGC